MKTNIKVLKVCHRTGGWLDDPETEYSWYDNGVRFCKAGIDFPR